MAAIFFFIVGIVMIAGGIFFIYTGYQTLTAPPSAGIPSCVPKRLEKILAVAAMGAGVILIGYGIMEIVGAFSAL